MRLLYARIESHIARSAEKKSKTDCRPNGRPDHVAAGTDKIQLLAPVVRGRKGMHQKLFEKAKRSGYVRVSTGGWNVYELSEEIPLDKTSSIHRDHRRPSGRQRRHRKTSDGFHRKCYGLSRGTVDRRCHRRRNYCVFPRVFPVPTVV